jgi:hypothetical protein
MSLGMRDFDGGMASGLELELPAAFGKTLLDALFPDAARIAFSSFSVTPAAFNRISSLVEVLNLLGPA